MKLDSIKNKLKKISRLCTFKKCIAKICEHWIKNKGCVPSLKGVKLGQNPSFKRAVKGPKFYSWFYFFIYGFKGPLTSALQSMETIDLQIKLCVTSLKGIKIGQIPSILKALKRVENLFSILFLHIWIFGTFNKCITNFGEYWIQKKVFKLL